MSNFVRDALDSTANRGSRLASPPSRSLVNRRSHNWRGWAFKMLYRIICPKLDAPTSYTLISQYPTHGGRVPGLVWFPTCFPNNDLVRYRLIILQQQLPLPIQLFSFNFSTYQRYQFATITAPHLKNAKSALFLIKGLMPAASRLQTRVCSQKISNTWSEWVSSKIIRIEGNRAKTKLSLLSLSQPDHKLRPSSQHCLKILLPLDLLEHWYTFVEQTVVIWRWNSTVFEDRALSRITMILIGTIVCIIRPVEATINHMMYCTISGQI